MRVCGQFEASDQKIRFSPNPYRISVKWSGDPRFRCPTPPCKKPSNPVITDAPKSGREAAPGLAIQGVGTIVKTGPFSPGAGRGLDCAPSSGAGGRDGLGHGAGVGCHQGHAEGLAGAWEASPGGGRPLWHRTAYGREKGHRKGGLRIQVR